MTTEDLNEATQRLLDLEAIHRVKATYGRVVDGVVTDGGGVRVEEFEEVFQPDAELNFPGTLGRHVGMTAIQALFGETLAGTRATMWHSFHSPLIDLNGDTASGVWTVHAFVRAYGEEDQPPSQVFGRYEETYVRTPRGWRIQTLTFNKG